MRIWILTCELAHEVAGGIARYVENFSQLAAGAGHDVLIFGRAETACDLRPMPGLRVLGFVPRWKDLSAACDSKRPDDHPGYPYQVLGYAQALSYEMAERVLALLDELPRPDVIECHEYMALPYYLLQRKLTERTPLDEIPIVVHMHGPLHELLRVNQEPRFRFPDWWTGEMEKACVVMADAVLSPSYFLANRIREILGPRFDATIARTPYPVDARSAAASEAPEPGEIIYVGRLQLLKGVLPMLAACSRMWAGGREFRLTMIGGDTRYTPRNTSMREYIQRKYQRWIDAGRLVIPGPMPYEQVLERMRRSWAAVVPSIWENFPNVCIEAMMSGTIVLGSTSGGQAEMIESDGVNGFLFDWSKAGDFERQLDRVLWLDPAERRAITVRAGRQIRELCAPENVLRARIDHFQRVIDEYRPRRTYPSLYSIARTDAPPRAAAAPAGWVAPPPAGPPRSDVPGLLSVVIPFYNLGAYVRETVESILRSTYGPFEIILVNDGSTDEASLRVLDELKRESIAELTIVHTENSGLAQTRNNGADHARGEYLCFLDADDCVEPTYFARAIDVLRRYPNVDFVSSWIRYFGEAHELWPVFDASLPYLLGHNMCTAFSVIRRQSFERWGRNKAVVEYALEDHEMWISMLEGGAVGATLPHPLVRYRVRKGSMLQSSTAAQQMYLFDVITQLHPELFRSFGVELFNLQNANGPSRLWNHPACEPPVPDPAQVAELRSWLSEVEKAREWSENQRLGLLERLGQLEDAVGELRGSVPLAGPVALAELTSIESSRAWRFVQALKRNPVYRMWAQRRYGADWEREWMGEDPAQRLLRIKNSRAFRMIQRVKASTLYRWYASLGREANGR